MGPRRYDAIVEGGEARHRIEVEREVREELLRRHRTDLEGSDPLKAFLLRTKISLRARWAARRLCGRGSYLTA